MTNPIFLRAASISASASCCCGPLQTLLHFPSLYYCSELHVSARKSDWLSFYEPLFPFCRVLSPFHCPFSAARSNARGVSQSLTPYLTRRSCKFCSLALSDRVSTSACVTPLTFLFLVSISNYVVSQWERGSNQSTNLFFCGCHVTMCRLHLACRFASYYCSAKCFTV